MLISLSLLHSSVFLFLLANMLRNRKRSEVLKSSITGVWIRGKLEAETWKCLKGNLSCLFNLFIRMLSMWYVSHVLTFLWFRMIIDGVYWIFTCYRMCAWYAVRNWIDIFHHVRLQVISSWNLLTALRSDDSSFWLAQCYIVIVKSTSKLDMHDSDFSYIIQKNWLLMYCIINYNFFFRVLKKLYEIAHCFSLMAGLLQKCLNQVRINSYEIRGVNVCQCSPAGMYYFQLWLTN